MPPTDLLLPWLPSVREPRLVCLPLLVDCPALLELVRYRGRPCYTNGGCMHAPTGAMILDLRARSCNLSAADTLTFRPLDF